jgi:glyoxylase-like metal-dependent hydrolase (beta-lactamase superfamily II)
VRIGDLEIFFLNAGALRLDGGSMFGSVPKELWQRWTPPDDKNRIELSTRSLVIRTPKACVLVDGGVGSHWDDKFNGLFEISAAPLEQVLQSEVGIGPDEITDVVVTHWHFDHVGGLVKRTPDGKHAPVFSNAQVHVQLANQNVAEAPSDRERASYLSETWQPYEVRGQLVLSHLSHSLDTEEILSGVHVQRTDGHTIGQQMVHVVAGKEHFVFCADLIPTQYHLKPHYSMGYDVQPLVLEREKKEVLRLAAKHGWVLIFEHDMSLPAAKVHLRETARGPVYELEPYQIS